MPPWRLAAATALILTVTSCSSSDDADEEQAVADDDTRSEEVLVPVERSTDLEDAEGSVVATAWVREEETSGFTEFELQAAGLSAGFHSVRLYDVATCDAVAPDTPSVVLPPLLVLDNGVASMTTLVGPVGLDDFLEGDGVTVVVGDTAVETPDALTDEPTGSRVACGAFTG